MTQQALFRKYISFLMVIVLLSITVANFCGSAHSPDSCADSHNAQSGSYLSAAEEGCPCCPTDEHAVPCPADSSCHCPCHAPLTPQGVKVVCSQLIASLEFSEKSKDLPEVFLSIFIPPQNHA